MAASITMSSRPSVAGRIEAAGGSMAGRSEPSMTLDAEVRVPVATTQLVRFHVIGPADNILREEETYWLDLCLTPRHLNARACYLDRWRPQRFERIGNVFLLPPRETMRARSDGGPDQTSVLCHLRPDSIRQWFEGDLEWTDQAAGSWPRYPGREHSPAAAAPRRGAAQPRFCERGAGRTDRGPVGDRARPLLRRHQGRSGDRWPRPVAAALDR